MFFDYLVLGASDTAGLNILDILATLFFFVLLMFLLKKVAWGPLMGIMTQREELVAGEIESAETSRKESQRLLEEQRALLKEARTEAIAIVENAKKQGEKSREEVITAARTEASILKESAIRDIDAEKERAIAAVRSEVVSLSVLAASKILEKEVSEEDNRALIEATIAKAGEAN